MISRSELEKKIFEEIRDIPTESLPSIIKIIHLIKMEITYQRKPKPVEDKCEPFFDEMYRRLEESDKFVSIDEI